MSSSARFLQRLAEEAERSLSPDEVARLVDEARSHLEDSIQARLELGFSAEEAERQAVASFGAARAVVEEERRREPKGERAFLVGSIGLALFFGTLEGVSMSALFGAISVVVCLVLVIALLAGSFLARRPQVVSVGGLFVATLGVASLVASFTKTTDLGSSVYLRRSEVAERLRMVQGQTRSDEQALARFTADLARFERGRPTSMPGIVLRPHDPGFNRFAMAAQKDRIARVSASLRQDSVDRLDLEAAASRPWWRQLPYAPATVFQEIWPPFAGLGAFHLLFWTLGWAWRRDKAQCRRPPTASS